MKPFKQLNLGIDASNIRQGGGLTHLACLLSNADPQAHGFGRVNVWANRLTLSRLPEFPWLDKITSPELESNALKRAIWQSQTLGEELRRTNCSLLFSPGGSLPRSCNVPMVTMSQNMLPFEPDQAELFGGFSKMRLKMRVLRHLQATSMRRASGVIFLSEYARNHLINQLGLDRHRTVLIPHGIEDRFFAIERSQFAFKPSEELRLLYVSILMPYKHQVEVGRAVASLEKEGRKISIDFVGEIWGSYGLSVRQLFQKLDPNNSILRLHGELPFDRLHTIYADANAFIFGSSCENLPNILIEAMASELPIVSSDRGPMPEVLGNAGFYFDPFKADSIKQAILDLMDDPQGARKKGILARAKARSYSWPRCAHDTLTFLAKVEKDSRSDSSPLTSCFDSI